MRAIDVHTADILELRNLFVRRTTFVRCTLIDGNEFTLVDRGMLNGNGMEAIAQRIIAYWHRQYPAASGAFPLDERPLVRRLSIAATQDGTV